MGFIDFFKKRKVNKADQTGHAASGVLPTPETMFALNYSAAKMIKDGDFVKHGFESQQDLVAAFTIVEMFGASSGKLSDDQVREIIQGQFGLSQERIDHLIAVAHQAEPK